MNVSKGDKQATVKLTVRNTGKVDGAEVVQIYVKDEKSSLERPEKELKEFTKVFLKAGESKEVEFTLRENAFQYYDETKKQFVLEPGKFIITAGSSSRDIRLTGEVEL